MTQLRPSNSLRRPSATQRRASTAQRQHATAPQQPNIPQRQPSIPQKGPSMSERRSSTSQGQLSVAQRRRSSLWPNGIPTLSPSTSVSPKEYLTELSNLLSYASTKMSEVDLPSLIWAFNRAHVRDDQTAIRQLGSGILYTLDKVQNAYYTFCNTRGTFDEDEIWKMVLGLGDEGSDFWDLVDDLGELIEIMEGEETEDFWRSLDDVMKKRA